MKLLYCLECEDVIKLKLGTMRHCDCGKVFGRYIDNSHAEVSENAISLAIGNGSLYNAINDSQFNYRNSNGKAARETYYEEGRGKISHAWVRPNEGEGNPHCRVIPKEFKKKAVDLIYNQILDNAERTNHPLLPFGQIENAPIVCTENQVKFAKEIIKEDI